MQQSQVFLTLWPIYVNVNSCEGLSAIGSSLCIIEIRNNYVPIDFTLLKRKDKKSFTRTVNAFLTSTVRGMILKF